ncbi:MAG: nucleotide exchange factor GrpE [Pyrinomonadaceae bacterium]|nr:nucleotide exchange factor GrpE [Pyrinomonadaceae bacterium]
MNSNSDLHNLTDVSEETETPQTLSIDEFFRQLEAKERDLDISSELIIEFDEDDDDGRDAKAITQLDLSPVESERPEILSPPAAPPENLPSQIELLNLRNEISKLQIQLIRTENERAEVFENARRRHTDFDNYKSRTERERSETFRNQLGSLAFQMLPVLDNMNRALDSTKTISDEKTTEFQQFFEGIELVSQQLNEILAEMGVQPIVAVGESFDPHLHEAVATEVTDEIASNTVTAELQRGYRIGDKVIRPSMVKVSVSSNTGKLPETLTLSEENLTDSE